ncbi:MAG: hydroxymethylbilane synthase, partial [Methylococcales bacterium]|nr:hydroxymethylbilane synthase [Methylococcales bacterium]
HHETTAVCVTAERAMNAKLNGGCQVPIAGFAQLENGEIFMRALVGNPDGDVIYRAEKRGVSAIEIGESLADDLLGQGAAEILKALIDG